MSEKQTNKGITHMLVGKSSGLVTVTAPGLIDLLYAVGARPVSDSESKSGRIWKTFAPTADQLQEIFGDGGDYAIIAKEEIGEDAIDYTVKRVFSSTDAVAALDSMMAA